MVQAAGAEPHLPIIRSGKYKVFEVQVGAVDLERMAPKPTHVVGGELSGLSPKRTVPEAFPPDLVNQGSRRRPEKPSAE